jgi:membrane-associated phospholipid phosphatase
MRLEILVAAGCLSLISNTLPGEQDPLEAISEQSHPAGVSAVGGLLISPIGWDRVSEERHWISDVTATVAMTSLVSRATVRWMETLAAHEHP